MGSRKDGQRDAGRVVTLFRDHNETLIRFLTRRLGNEADAADVAQITFIKLLGVSNPAVITNPRSYMFQVAVNSATDFMRQRKRQNNQIDGLSRPPADNLAALPRHPGAGGRGGIRGQATSGGNSPGIAGSFSQVPLDICRASV